MPLSLQFDPAVWVKAAARDAKSDFALKGEFVVSEHQGRNWGLLTVPNSVVRGLFDAMDDPELELPPSGAGGRLKAHISVIRPEEFEKAQLSLLDKMRGKRFSYQLGPIKTVNPKGWDDMNAVWFVAIKSPELSKLRTQAGLTPLPVSKRTEMPFHLTVAVRRKKNRPKES